jgi:hypothetical protein
MEVRSKFVFRPDPLEGVSRSQAWQNKLIDSMGTNIRYFSLPLVAKLWPACTICLWSGWPPGDREAPPAHKQIMISLSSQGSGTMIFPSSVYAGGFNLTEGVRYTKSRIGDWFCGDGCLTGDPKSWLFRQVFRLRSFARLERWKQSSGQSLCSAGGPKIENSSTLFTIYSC